MSVIRSISIGMMGVALGGCASTQTATGQGATGQNTMNTNHTIELLYFDGCPNTPPFRESLEAAVAKSNTSFTPIDLTTLDENDPRRGYGSPTILIDSHDLFGAPVPSNSMMSCRIYADGLPDRDAIYAKLSEKAQ
jgi:hypothetical protein